MKNDTIAAVSTAVAESGIGIIRISGEQAFSVIDQIYESKNGKKRLSEQPSHTIHYGFIKEGNDVIDEVLVSVMRAPRTFTAEDTVEINCHGGVCAMKKILETVIANGVRPAEPGEFTKRAFLNGRIDLSQAEAVMDVIQSKNEYALKSSVSQLRGSVKKAVGEMREEILQQIAHIEAALDDPEHISLDGFGEEARETEEKLIKRIDQILAASEDGILKKEGIRAVIAGKPNAGKSSFLNALIGQDRAIVTDIEGTTRDILEETVQIRGITLHITDTAGIRETEDVVEKIGVGKAKNCLQEADLVLYIADSSRKLDENDREIIQMMQGKKGIILLNKSDLETVTTEETVKEAAGDNYPVICISAREETGLDQFAETLKELFFAGEISFNQELCITNLRQKALIEQARESLLRVLEGITLGMPEDFLSIDLRSAYEALGGITGDTAGEDMVDQIFGKFCLGK